jgi:hypothetical protein
MKRILLFCLYYILPITFFAQSNIIDSLKKYSYLLILTQKSKIDSIYNVVGLATGFFIKNKRSLYLVSANHVFTGNDPFTVTRTDSTSPDMMAFHYDVKGLKQKGHKEIYLDSLKAKNPPKSIKEWPDILEYSIELPQNAQINSIESFLMDTVSLERGDSIFSWGYPAQQTDPVEAIKFYIKNPYPLLYRGIFIRSTDSLNYMAKPGINYGASGAPMFVKKKINGLIKFVFTGVLSSSSDINNLSFFVIYKELLKKIKIIN